MKRAVLLLEKTNGSNANEGNNILLEDLYWTLSMDSRTYFVIFDTPSPQMSPD